MRTNPKLLTREPLRIKQVEDFSSSELNQPDAEKRREEKRSSKKQRGNKESEAESGKGDRQEVNGEQPSERAREGEAGRSRERGGALA